ncbi:UPF0481 protein At3g47200-like [Vicia villosa]|uniref:UPF0481 protein At3g47200-like n=1 Tax=Vicia villosa TaxID=3911 RepID=UPI00273A7985|nr:UPF0481 protein At3g47200-like [Vicia villosa]
MMASHTTLENKLIEFVELVEAKQTYQNSRPKIQKVPEHLRNRKQFEKHYSPKFVPIGPIHNDNPNLKLGENYKLTWAAKYIQNTQQNPQLLHKKIAEKIDELKGLYADDVLADTRESLKGFDCLDEKMSWMLFVDGCFLLFILMYVGDQIDRSKHPDIKYDQLVLVIKDVLLLENQLPYLLLKLLWKNDNEYELIGTMKNFFKYPVKRTWRRPENLPNEPVTPTHLLDLQREILLTKSNPKVEGNNEEYKIDISWKCSEEKSKVMTYRNIQSLSTVGIIAKSSGTRRLKDVDFSKQGLWAWKLILPEIVVDDTTAASLLNLAAYEMCSDFENDYGICSFVVFMHSLIDYPEDVMILGSKGILVNLLGSNEKVVDLFNTISTDLVFNPETYYEVKAKIHECYNVYRIWMTLLHNTLFNGDPWSIITLIITMYALIFTVIQTWFTMYPRH